MADPIVNFAYGSNLLPARIRERAPSARALGQAVLDGHELTWSKIGRDGSGKCSVVASAAGAGRVHGVLYAITPEDKPALDRAEGLGAGYEEVEVRVRHDGRLVEARMYRATWTDPRMKPFDWYRALVIAGAREHGLPDDYIAGLLAVETIEDPEPGRREAALRLISASRSR